MNLTERMILDDYRKSRGNFVRLGDLVQELLHEMLETHGIKTMAVEHRVKKEDSLIGKLNRKQGRYQQLSDLTDILGARVICYFTDDVDRVGKLVEQAFVVDWENSTDKRALLREDSFGYLSLHYICSLPENAGYPSELCGLKFEIQIRTILQHTWAAINHDLGYKSEFGVPRVFARALFRISGLLELADDEFVRVRDGIHAYSDEIRSKIEENRADDVLIDLISLREYMQRNCQMQAFLQELSQIGGAEVEYIDPESYLVQLRWLGKTTLGDLQTMLAQRHDLALALASRALTGTDLDILSSNVALRYLCRAELYAGGYTEAQAKEFLKLSVKDGSRAKRQAHRLMDVCRELEGQQHEGT